MDNIRISAPNDKGAHAKTEKVSLGELAELIKADGDTSEICQKIRTDSSLSRDDIKKLKWDNLRGVELHSICNGGRLWTNVSSLTGYCVLDYDEEDVPYDIFKENIIKNQIINPCLVFFSPQRKLKIVVKVKELEGLTGTPAELKSQFEFYYMQLVTYMSKCYEVKADTSCCDVVRLTYMSYDPDVYVNDSAYTNVTFKKYGDKTVDDEYTHCVCGGKSCAQKSAAYISKKDKVRLQCVLLEFAKFCLSNQITILDEYNDWIGFGANCKEIFDSEESAIEVWESCSYYSSKYEDGCCAKKFLNLPSATFVGVIGHICNLFKNKYPDLANKYNIREWMRFTKKKYGLL